MFFFVLITLMTPTEVMILALFRFVSDLGWKDTLAGLTVPLAAPATGAFLFRQHFANLPRDLARPPRSTEPPLFSSSRKS